MSILIKDMEMPSEQYGKMVITLYPNGHVAEYVGDIGRVWEAVPIPSHGRLIDADAFLSTVRPICNEDAYAGCTFETVKRLMIEHINNAPTIIGAEEGE